MIDELKNENIKFKEISEKEALNYLKQNNNYYNICLYKNLFEKYYINGEYINKYIDLDFAYLKDLAIIDFELRLLLYNMISDVEHYLKFRLVKILNENRNVIEKYLDKNNRNKYVGNKKINDKLSVNDFLNFLSFGKIVEFYEFTIKQYKIREDKKYIFLLKEIVVLRNNVYHNRKILINLNEYSDNYIINPTILDYLKKCNIDKNMKNIISNSSIRQFTCLLYIFNSFVTSKEIKNHVNELLNDFMFDRVNRNKNYYKNNKLLKMIYKFFKKIIIKEFSNSH